MPTPTPSPWLAQSESGSVLGWSLLLIVLLLVMFIAIGMLRKWIAQQRQEDSGPPTGFTLGDLRRMREEGQITEEEYERARTQMIAATQRAAERTAQQAAEAAQAKGAASSAVVTDIEELRQRARRHRAAGQEPPPTPPSPPMDPNLPPPPA